MPEGKDKVDLLEALKEVGRGFNGTEVSTAFVSIKEDVWWLSSGELKIMREKIATFS